MKRIFLNQPLENGIVEVDLYHRLIKVLRYKINDTIIVFNSTTAMSAKILAIGKPNITLLLEDVLQKDLEDESQIHIGISVIRPSRMDYAIEKATELKVASITPIFSEFSQGQYHEKHIHWKKIIISACEQANVYKVPKLNEAINLTNWVKDKTGIYFHPYTQNKINGNIKKPCHVLIGPEGGFSDKEINMLKNWSGYSLGKNILRAETAVVSALSLIHHYI
jgi:16S rRNA (uracil1498-N3)-methyltransferase